MKDWIYNGTLIKNSTLRRFSRNPTEKYIIRVIWFSRSSGIQQRLRHGFSLSQMGIDCMLWYTTIHMMFYQTIHLPRYNSNWNAPLVFWLLFARVKRGHFCSTMSHAEFCLESWHRAFRINKGQIRPSIHEADSPKRIPKATKMKTVGFVLAQKPYLVSFRLGPKKCYVDISRYIQVPGSPYLEKMVLGLRNGDFNRSPSALFRCSTKPWKKHVSWKPSIYWLSSYELYNVLDWIWKSAGTHVRFVSLSRLESWNNFSPLYIRFDTKSTLDLGHWRSPDEDASLLSP